MIPSKTSASEHNSDGSLAMMIQLKAQIKQAFHKESRDDYEKLLKEWEALRKLAVESIGNRS